MTRYAIFALAALAACNGDEGKDTGDTGTTPGDDDDNGNCEAQPTIVVFASVTCDNPGTQGSPVTYQADTDGWSSTGSIFAQETANPETPYPQYADEHDIATTGTAAGCADHLEGTATASNVFPAAANETTFGCGAEEHIADVDASGNPVVMSYAAGVNDFNGNFADCLAWGHDPQGMIDDVYDRGSDPSFDLSNCVIGQPAR